MVTQGEDQGDNLCYGLQDCYTVTTTTSVTVSRDDLVDSRTNLDNEKDGQDQKAQTAQNVASAILAPVAGLATLAGCAESMGALCYGLAVVDAYIGGAIPQFVGDMFGSGAEDLGQASSVVTDVLDANPNATSFTVTRTVTTQTANVPEAPGEFTQTLNASFTISGGDGKPRAFSASAPLTGYNPLSIISSIFGF